jgi:hypothetical protein
MVAVQPLVSEFAIVGRLSDLVVSPKGRIKSLCLSTPEADYTMEVAKEAKERGNVLSTYLKPGCQLKVTGMRKNKLHQAEISYRAYSIELLPPSEISRDNSLQTNKPKIKIIVCQGSSCRRKGGSNPDELLRAELQGQDMTEEVEIKTTGCWKQCKQAPNIRYIRRS